MAQVESLGFSMPELIMALDAGQVRVQQHPEFPELQIFNYTEEVQFRKGWNNITLACRGLILNMVTGEIVARPWKKFFNLGERDNRIDSNAPVEVTDKMDGSLGILYRRPDGKVAIATRGSFASEQAQHATRLWQDEYEMYHDFNEVIDEFTFLFEIIYPENRIVVNYGGLDDLVMLGAVNKEHGYYLGPIEATSLLGWIGPVTQSWNYDSFVDAISFPDREGKEGVVIRSGTNMVKLKQADYVELHRIVTNLSPKTVWSMIGAGASVDDICSGIPDEFHAYVEDIGNDLLRQASEIKWEAQQEFLGIMLDLRNGGSKDPVPRKKFAEKATKSRHVKYLFSLLDGKPIDDVVWNSIKPRGDKPLVQGEDS